MKAFAYVRVSTDRQELSPEVQTEQVRAYCSLKGFEIVAVFEEVGVSGSVPLADRPRGAEMLARLGEADTIVFAKLDRAFRDTVDCILTVERMREAGKAVAFLDLGVDTTTPAGGLCLEMMAAFAKFERRRISERTREALATAKGQGKKIGPAPLGYRNAATVVDGRKVDGGVWTPVDSELQLVRRIVRMRESMTLRAIAEKLNAEKVPTRRGGVWAPETIRKVTARAR